MRWRANPLIFLGVSYVMFTMVKVKIKYEHYANIQDSTFIQRWALGLGF